ncbi:MAG TPA: hypothetical protein VED41_12475, partial [Solirubrobacteraceae bacterium]|nr:hypothetical protein [Solirubrobacteraceae bacterium]
MAAPVLAVLLALLTCASAAGASAPVLPSSLGVRRVCGAQHAAVLTPAASCTALRLVPASQTQAELPAGVGGEASQETAGEAAGENASPLKGFLTPANLHAAYDMPTETPSSATQTVAVIDAFDDPTAEADLAVYDEQFGLPACTTANGCFRKVNQKGQAGPLPPEQGEWAGEISVDVQMVHAICQNCHILLVEAESEEAEDLGAGVNT